MTGAPRDVTALINELKSIAPTDRPTAADALWRLRRIADKAKRAARHAVAALLLAVFVFGTAKYMFDLRHERAAAVAAEARAVVAQKEAATRRAQAEDLISFMLGDLRGKLQPLGKLELLDDVGERALAYSESLQPELMTASELARSSKALGQLGQVRIAQGRLAEAATIFAKAREVSLAAVRKEPANQDAQLALMNAYFSDGEVAQLRGDLDAALRHCERYLATAQKLAAGHPGNEEYRIEQAYAHANVGTLLMEKARYSEARAHFEEALRIKRARLARDPLNLPWQADLANTINKVGVNMTRIGDFAGARKQFQEQKQINQKLVSIASDHAQWRVVLGYSHGYLASVLVSLGELAEARREFEAELRIERSLVETDANNAFWKRQLAVTHSRLAVLESRAGLETQADSRFAEAQRLFAELRQLDPSRVSYRNDLAFATSRMALVHLQRKRIDRARAEWQRASSLLGSNPGSEVVTRTNTAELILTGIAVARAAGEPWRIDELAARADALLAAPPLAGSSDPEVAALRTRLLVSTGRREQAQPLIQRLWAMGYRQPDFEWTLRAE